MSDSKPHILLIYTGGTIGMMQNPKTGALQPFNFNHLSKQVPELYRLAVELSSLSFKRPIDSSNMSPEIWVELAEIIEKNYSIYDGFVILHGSDTMAYTASALSFMLENLNKPVILTGSQLPIGIIRTDGKENLITAIEIAAARKKGKAILNEVAIYFEYELYRGNRTLKYNSAHFDAFKSPNYPVLAEAGVTIEYNKHALAARPAGKKLIVHKRFGKEIIILRLYPGISKQVVSNLLSMEGVKAVILQTYGSGNAPTDEWFIELLQQAIAKKIHVLNITQCQEGRVIQGKYETSSMLEKIGVIGGSDMTMEAATTKLMFLLGQKLSYEKLCTLIVKNLRGELTED